MGFNYESYKKQYEQQKEFMESRGYSMWQDMYTKEEYEFQATALANTRKMKGKARGNINRDLAAEQRYEPYATNASAKAMQDLKKETTFGPQKKISASERAKERVKIRAEFSQGSLDPLYQEIKKRREELFAEGRTKSEVNRIISQEFFGSTD